MGSNHAKMRFNHVKLRPKQKETGTSHHNIFATQPIQQTGSLLFTKLPPEVRSHIFAYALTDYPDTAEEKRYSAKTCYTRPGYFAPRRSDTALLQTCRAVYSESWFLPFQLREQVHWLTESSRAPPEDWKSPYDTAMVARARQKLAQPLISDTLFEIRCMRIFAQMYMLEGGKLASVLQSVQFFPRQLVLTIRHADWWHWEVNTNLYFNSNWIEAVSSHLPDSVREFRIDIETVSRKRPQLDDIAKQMSEKWFFKRKDGNVLYPDVTRHLVSETSWLGASEWHNRRWDRDEIEDGVIEFIIMSIPFRQEHAIEKAGGGISSEARKMAEADDFDADKMMLKSWVNVPQRIRPEVDVLDMLQGAVAGQEEDENVVFADLYRD